MQAMAGAFGFLGPGKRYAAPRRGDTIAHESWQGPWGCSTNPDVTHALDGVLVVVADHEFTPATFAARIAASAGNDLYSCVGAALQVHFGSALGLRCDLLEQRLSAPQSPETERAAAAISIVACTRSSALPQWRSASRSLGRDRRKACIPIAQSGIRIGHAPRAKNPQHGSCAGGSLPGAWCATACGRRSPGIRPHGRLDRACFRAAAGAIRDQAACQVRAARGSM